MSSEFPTLHTTRLLLRQIGEDDLDNVFRGLSHPDVIRYYGIRFDTRDAAREQMRWFADLEKTGKGIWWAVCSRDNRVFYGAGGLNGINKTHKKAEAGFWLLPEYWNKGIMSEALPLICNFGFESLALHRIEGFVEPKNLSSKRALKKLNFRHEGTMIDCEIKNGEYISLEIYAFINPQKDG